MSVTKALKDIRDAFVAVCRRHGGRLRDTSTCVVSQEQLYHALGDLSREVVSGEVQPRFTRLKFVSESMEAGKTHRTAVELVPFGRTVRVNATVTSEIHDRLSKWFRKESARESIRAEGVYHIKLDNEFLIRSWGDVETTWSNLSDDVYRLISKLSIEGSKTAGAEREAWGWFKKKVEESEDWWELTRR